MSKNNAKSRLYLPNLVLVGLFKAATTSLYYHLSKHPEIYIGTKKELHLLYNDKFSIHDYTRYFECPYKKEKYILEASPGYFDGGQEIANQLKMILGDIKTFVILRNPVDLVVSNYMYGEQLLSVKDTDINTFLAKIISSRKDRWDELYLQWDSVFGENFKVIFFDHLVSNSSAVFFDLCNWLGIDYSPIKSIPFIHENKTFYPKSTLIQHAYMSIVPFLRDNIIRSKRLKTFLTKIYYFINEDKKLSLKDEKSDLSCQIHGQVEKYMRDELRALAAILAKKGYNLPDWLSKLN